MQKKPISKNKTNLTALKEMIVNNPRAKDRIAVKEIEKEIRTRDKKLESKSLNFWIV